MDTIHKKESKFRLVDVTLRDGGLVNEFHFTDEFVRNLYQTNLQIGIDYMEFGYKASKRIFSPEKFGKWKFCEEDTIRRIVGENPTNMKISVMVDVGRTDYKSDILDKRDSVIDMIRIATYMNGLSDALEMIEYIKKKGYMVTCNIMAISTNKKEEILQALELLGKSAVDGIYIVDSYGALYPKEVKQLVEEFMECAEKYHKFVGIHAHNNLQLAFANTITAIEEGVSFADVSVNGLGRGAGNCMTELLLTYLKEKQNYYFEPICSFLEHDLDTVRKEKNKWGYEFPYLLTAYCNCHPQEAISFLLENKKGYQKLYEDIKKEGTMR